MEEAINTGRTSRVNFLLPYTQDKLPFLHKAFRTKNSDTIKIVAKNFNSTEVENFILEAIRDYKPYTATTIEQNRFVALITELTNNNDKKKCLPKILKEAWNDFEVFKSILKVPKISKEISAKIDDIFNYLWDEIYEKKDNFRIRMEISNDKKETELPKKQNEIFFNALTTLWNCDYQDQIKSYLTVDKMEKLREFIEKDSTIQIPEELKQYLFDKSEMSVTSIEKLDQNNNRDLGH